MNGCRMPAGFGACIDCLTVAFGDTPWMSIVCTTESFLLALGLSRFYGDLFLNKFDRKLQRWFQTLKDPRVDITKKSKSSQDASIFGVDFKFARE